MAETKNERFQRIAEKRVNNLISGLYSLGKLARSDIYEYTPEQIDCMFAALQTELDRTKRQFATQQFSFSGDKVRKDGRC